MEWTIVSTQSMLQNQCENTQKAVFNLVREDGLHHMAHITPCLNHQSGYGYYHTGAPLLYFCIYGRGLGLHMLPHRTCYY